MTRCPPLRFWTRTETWLGLRILSARAEKPSSISTPRTTQHGLPFRLLADTSTEMLQAFGAWGEKKMYGKTVLGTLRRTFIFDEAGILERIIEKVDTKNAASQVLEG